MSLSADYLAKWKDVGKVVTRLLNSGGGGGSGITSHIGMVIFSATLNTEAAVIATYGGTAWSKIEGQFILGASSTHAAGSTGGEAQHTLTIDEMPSHTHQVDDLTKDVKVENASQAGGGFHHPYRVGDTNSSGGDQPHNNMPPFKAVYIWERTA